MSNKEEVSVWVIKNKSTGEYLYGDENFVDDFSKASKWKRSSSAVEKLYYLGKRGYEWYPEWAEKADDEDTKENYWRKAKECTELFNNCVIENYNQTYTLVHETKMEAKVKHKTEWDFEIIADTD